MPIHVISLFALFRSRIFQAQIFMFSIHWSVSSGHHVHLVVYLCSCLLLLYVDVFGVQIFVCVRAHLCVYVCIYYTSVCTCECVYGYMCIICACSSVCVCVCVCVCQRACMCMHLCMCVCAHMRVA